MWMDLVHILNCAVFEISGRSIFGFQQDMRGLLIL